MKQVKIITLFLFIILINTDVLAQDLVTTTTLTELKVEAVLAKNKLVPVTKIADQYKTCIVPPASKLKYLFDYDGRVVLLFDAYISKPTNSRCFNKSIITITKDTYQVIKKQEELSPLLLKVKETLKLQ